MTGKMVIDGKNASLGRLASYAAKQALLGKEVIIVNCNLVVIVGKPKNVINEYGVTRKRGGSSLKGPFFPKYPERIVKRTIRGMLSYKEGRGKEAFRKIKCYNDTPNELSNAKKFVAGKEKKVKTIKLEELSEKI